MKKVLALDFDGVIWNSAGECFQTGWRAYQELTGRDLSGRVFERGFLRGRPLARTGHDFYLLLKLMEEDPERDLAAMSLPEFVKLRAVHHDEMLKFDRVFYLLRAHFREVEPDVWMSWQQPYGEMMTLLDEWEEKFSGVALATTKDTLSAQSLMNSVDRYWPVFGKEFSVHKADQILGIAQHFKVEPNQILFIDDLLENLQQVEPTAAVTALAKWGYNFPDSWSKARELGHWVVDLDDTVTLFAQFLGKSS